MAYTTGKTQYENVTPDAFNMTANGPYSLSKSDIPFLPCCLLPIDSCWKGTDTSNPLARLLSIGESYVLDLAYDQPTPGNPIIAFTDKGLNSSGDGYFNQAWKLLSPLNST